MALVTSNLPLILKRRQGNVGIGTNNPLRTFHVEGDMRITGNIYDAYDQPFSSGGGGGSANLQWRPAPVYPQVVAPTMGSIAGLSYNTVYRYSGNEIVYHLDHAVRVTAQTNDLARNYTMDLPVPFNSNAYYTGTNVLGEFWLKVSSNEYSTTYKALARASPTLSNQLYLRYVSGTSERSWADFAADYTLAFSGVISYQTESYYLPTPVANPVLSANFSQDSVGNIVINGGGWGPRARLDIIQANCNLPVLIADQQAVQSVDIFQAKRNTITKFAITGSGDLVVTGNVYNCNYQPLWLPATAVEWNNAVDPSYTVPDGITLTYTSNNAKYRFAGQEVAYQFSTIATLTGSASNPIDNLELTIAPYFSDTAYPTSTIVGDLWITASNAGNTTLYQGYARTIPNTNGERVSLRYLNTVYDRSFTDFSTNTILDIRGTLLYESSNTSFFTVPQPYTPARMKQTADGRIIVSQIESAPQARFHIKEASSEPVMIIEQTGVGQGDIFQYRSNEHTTFVVNRHGNIGMGTSTAWHPLDIMGNMRITGNILNASNEAVWIPGTTVQWKTAEAPIYTLPEGATMTYSASNATFRYIGNEIIYNFSLQGLIDTAPTYPGEDYKLQLQYPILQHSYPIDTVVGDLWFNVTSNAVSTTYKAYAKTMSNPSSNYQVTIRYLNGALDQPISVIAPGSSTTLQGTIVYQTVNIANAVPLPLSEFKSILQDQDDNLIINGGGAATLARLSVYQTSNQPAFMINDIATNGPDPALTDIMNVRRNNVPIFNIRQNGDVRITGNILDTNSNASWIPGSTLEWKNAYPPLLGLPAGVNFAYMGSNASYRYIGNELIYNFSITGTVSGTAINPANNYEIGLTYPVKASMYPTETVIGSMVMNVYSQFGSNTYPGYIRTHPGANTNPVDTYKAVLRYINGTYDRSLTDVQNGAVLKLQGQFTYNTNLIANNVAVPTLYTEALFTQDQQGGVIFNGQGNAPQGMFEIRSTCNVAALVVNQTTDTSVSDILSLRKGFATKVVVDSQGNVGIGTTTPNSMFHIRAPPPEALLEYPPSALTTYTQVLYDQAYGNGSYTVSGSSEYSSDYQVWKAFNKVTYQNDSWISSSTAFSSGAGNEYIEIKFPDQIYLKFFRMWNRNGHYSPASPGEFTISGGTDLANYTVLATFRNVTFMTDTSMDFEVGATQKYNSYRITVTRLGLTNAIYPTYTTYLQIGEIAFFGYQTLPTTLMASLQMDASDIDVYPPEPMTGDITYMPLASYGKGTYTATASSILSNDSYNYGPYVLFNVQTGNNDAGGAIQGGWWATSTSTSYSISGIYAGSFFTQVGGNTYYGEWVQLQMPVRIYLKYYTINPRWGWLTQSPKKWYLVASNDGTNWTQLDYRESISFRYNMMYQFQIYGSPIAYQYYRLAILETNNTSGTTNHCAIEAWNLYGIEQTSSLMTVRQGMIGIGNSMPEALLHVSGNLFAPGHVIQTVAIRTDRIYRNWTAANSGNGTIIAPVDIKIAPKRVNSMIILDWMLNGEMDHDNVFLIHRNAVLIGYNRQSGNSRWSGVVAGTYDQNVDSTPQNFKIMYIDYPGSTHIQTYSIAVRSSNGTAHNFNLNTVNASDGQDGQETMISVGVAFEICM